MSKRAQGCFFLVCGAILAYFCVYGPLESAAQNEPHVSISLKGAALVPVSLGLGTVYLLLGESATTLFGPRERPSWVAWLFAIVCLGVGVLLYLGLKARLEQAGYQF